MTNTERTELLRNALKPLYANLIKNVHGFDYEKANFCMQWGENFSLDEHSGILFVGRATNGWIDESVP